MPSRAATAAPLAAALSRASAEQGIAVRLGAPWGAGFLRPGAADLRPHAEQEMRFKRADARVAGSRLSRSVVLVSVVAVAAALADGVAPALRPRDVLMRPRRTREGMPSFAVGQPAARTAVGGRDALLRELGADAGALLAPAVEAVHAATRFSRAAQWGLAAWLLADVCLAGLGGAGEGERRRAVGALLGGDERLARRAPELVVAAAERGAPRLRTLSRACCLSYRWGHEPGRCGGCPLVADDERPALWAEEDDG